MILTIVVPGAAHTGPEQLADILDGIAAAVYGQVDRDVTAAIVTIAERRLTIPNRATEAGRFTIGRSEQPA